MNRTPIAAVAVAVAVLAGCATIATPTSTAPAATSGTAAAPASAAPPTAKASTAASVAAGPVTASTVARAITAAVPQAKQIAVFTAASDPNHLLGRPHEYTSKVEFKDTRIDTGQVQGQPPGSLQYGASVEVFSDPTDAGARMGTIQANAAGQPAIVEYDYVHGTVLVRVSHYLTPDQAAAYDKAAAAFG